MKLHIYLFRHGQTYYNKSKRFTGWKDSRLTPAGIEHSKILAEKLRDKTFSLAFKSRLSRSSDTLQAVLKYHPECQEIIIDDRIIERSYGNLEGKFHKTIIKKYGRKQFDIWHRSYDTPPPGGESIKMVEKRVLCFIADLVPLMRRKRVDVAISAHGNSMRPFRRYFEDFTIDQMMKLEMPFDQYFEYYVT
jgi:2,3-bisphosphoglycerate-dependent phosphoglycerate mutase